MPETSGLAIAGLVMSILCSPIGLILSLMARGEIAKSEGRLTGDGLALAGIIISICQLVIGLAIIAGR